MADSVDRLTIEFLRWIAGGRRTYADAMETWRSTCPRISIWENALSDGLIQIEAGETLDRCAVMLTPRGRAALVDVATQS